MFNSSKKSKIEFSPDKKIEDKVSSDFRTHNMPEPHRFSGQTYINPQTVVANKELERPANLENHHKIGILIIGGGLILVVALFYFGYSFFIKPYLNQTPKTVADNSVVQTPATTSDEIAEESKKVVEIIPPSEPTISTSTENVATSTDVAMPEDKQVFSVAPVSTVDSDADGLTDAEEKIIGTDPNKADTDNDGYLELAELKSGYDPLVPGKKNSETSIMYNYQVDSKMSLVYPAAWDVTKSDATKTTVFADSDKAFIQVAYEDNITKSLPSVWFAQQFPGLTPGESVSGQGWQGFFSQDGLAAYIFNQDFSKVYSFECTPLTSDTISVTVFHMMIKTLIIK